ncbi:hypothetical protein PF010_g25366 [Phytophthora fragariae]|uniref:Uncharacterized protein n=1 Tax=Phytophthora fragariae TaxID=53985 RepID=A0A6A3U2E5_9STRA|nr:hypothetical protein PF010_g25366 [Phytophthora fragariae]KAE9143799.1 hypothetical protein PF006_g11209 [Phytophthora fragariae]KAE9271818.1 hypothetical protein PF001_g28210 [Phytophthora fragariae]
MSYAVLSFVKCSEKLHIGATTRTRSARLQRQARHHRSSTDRYQHGSKTVHVLLDVSYSVPNFVKSDEKSHIVAVTRTRPARLLERLRHHRSSPDRRQYGAQHRARVVGHVVRGAELREEQYEVPNRS